MNNSYLLISFILLGAIIVFAAIYFGVKHWKAERIYRIGKNGERKVRKALEKVAKKLDGKLINDIYLPLYDNTTQIDHILIGNFGMVVVETKNIAGEIYGEKDEKYWMQILKSERKKLYNPLEQNQAHIDCIRHWLQKEQVYKVEIDSLVVFASKNCRLYTAKKLPVITIKQVQKYFKKRKFKKDASVDVDQVYNAIMKHQVTDPKKIKEHIDFVKEVSAKKD